MEPQQRILSTMTGGAAVTPNDGADLSAPAKALWIGGTGNVKVDMIDGTTITLNSVPVGMLDVYVKRVYATGTTATNIVAMYSK